MKNQNLQVFCAAMVFKKKKTTHETRAQEECWDFRRALKAWRRRAAVAEALRSVACCSVNTRGAADLRALLPPSAPKQCGKVRPSRASEMEKTPAEDDCVDSGAETGGWVPVGRWSWKHLHIQRFFFFFLMRRRKCGKDLNNLLHAGNVTFCGTRVTQSVWWFWMRTHGGGVILIL